MDRVVRVRCGAKLNLFLRVLGRRSDGYHELESVFHAIDLVDELELSPAESDVRVSARWAEGSSRPLPSQEDNIVTRALTLIRDRENVSAGVAVSLDKRIPVAAGLGGGSSDAAGALVGARALWDLETDLDELALELGSDVPFCLRGGSVALVEGRGERVTPLESPPIPLWFVLGVSDAPLLTASVYGDHRGAPDEAPIDATDMALALAEGDPDIVASLLWNDLTPAALRLRPEIRLGLNALLEAGALGAALAGSGPTVYGVATDETHARSISEAVTHSFDRVLVARSAPGCVTLS